MSKLLPVMMLAGPAVQLISGGIAQGKANAMDEEINARQDALDNFQRQPVPNFASNIEDMSSMIQNPYANLSVATQAAEMQAEETDIALANTLDTLAASGMSAGGATALANAAAKSKIGISASIEQQEVNNQKLRAQGEQQAQIARMSEKVRVQNAETAALAAQFEATERREDIELDRMQGQYDNMVAQQNQYKSDASAAFTGALGGFTSSYISGQAGGMDMGFLGDYS